MKEFLKKIPDKIQYILERPILTSIIVLSVLSIFVGIVSYPYYVDNYYDMIINVIAEMHGSLFDIVILGILITWLNQNGQRRLRIKTYIDEIDDFRLWESAEAAFRTVGNIKRLNRHKIFDIDLANCSLKNTNLSYVTLDDSNLNNANLKHSSLVEASLKRVRMNQTNLEDANLNQANLEGAYASGANFTDAYLIKANLEKAFLIKANFTKGFLMESDLRGSYVTGANFEEANLYKADLRGAVGLTVEQLKDVRSLYLAKFDDELLEQLKVECPDLLGK